MLTAFAAAPSLLDARADASQAQNDNAEPAWQISMRDQEGVSSSDAIVLPFADTVVQDPPGGRSRPTTMFDVGYVSRVRVENSTSARGGCIGAVINTGGDSVDLSTATVVELSCDHPSAAFALYINGGHGVLKAGEGAGRLNQVAEAMLIESDIVSEPLSCQQFRLSYKLANLPQGRYSVNARAVLEISGVQITLPMTFDVDTNGPQFGVSYLEASRLSTN